MVTATGGDNPTDTIQYIAERERDVHRDVHEATPLLTTDCKRPPSFKVGVQRRKSVEKDR